MATNARVLALIALAALLYAGSVGIPFRIDDRALLDLKPNLASPGHWWALFREPYYVIREAGPGQYYRPLPSLLQKAQYRLFAADFAGYHLVNLVLHLLNGWLVFRVARLLVRRPGGAVFAAALFLLHPLQTEVVNYISHFTCLLSTTAMLSAVLCYLLHRRRGGGGWYGLSLVFSAAAMLSKESALVLPIIFTWCEAVLPRRRESSGLLRRLAVPAGYFLALLGYLVLRRSLLIGGQAGFGGSSPSWLSLLTAGKGALVYARLILFPSGLHFFRSLSLETNPWRLTLLLPLVSVFSAGVWFVRRRSRLPPALSLGFGWLVIGLLPVSGLRPMLMQDGVLFWAEHFLYFPLAGAALLAAGLGDGLASAPSRLFIRCASAVVACWTALAVSQNLLWLDEIAFARQTAAFEPGIFRSHELMGKAFFNRGDYAAGVAEFEEAQRILGGSPAAGDFERHRQAAYLSHLTVGYRLLGRDAAARKAAEGLIALSPGDYNAYYQCGLAAWKQGDAEAALSPLRKAYELNPRDYRVVAMLYGCLRENGRQEAAARVRDEAVRNGVTEFIKMLEPFETIEMHR